MNSTCKRRSGSGSTGDFLMLLQEERAVSPFQSCLGLPAAARQWGFGGCAAWPP